MSGKRRRIAVVAVFFAIFVFLSLPVRVSTSVKEAITNFFSPLLSLARSATEKFSDIWKAAFHSNNIVRENLRKEQEISKLRAELAGARQKIKELASFHSQLEEMAKSGLELLAAKVIGAEPDSWYQTLLINRGTNDGVRRGMAVTHGENLVGRIVEVGAGWSRVRLILDARSAIPALTNDSRAAGLVVGEGPGELRMTYIEHSAKVQVGDVVVTAHLGKVLTEDEAPLPGGLVIGTITSVSQKEEGLYQSAVLKSPVDFRYLFDVLVFIPR